MSGVTFANPVEVVEALGSGPLPTLTNDEFSVDGGRARDFVNSIRGAGYELQLDEISEGTAIHGQMTLALLLPLIHGLLTIGGCERIVNYSIDTLRFTNPVRVGDVVRATVTPARAEAGDRGVRLWVDIVIHVVGAERPALVASLILFLIPAAGS